MTPLVYFLVSAAWPLLIVMTVLSIAVGLLALIYSFDADEPGALWITAVCIVVGCLSGAGISTLDHFDDSGPKTITITAEVPVP